jgi:lipoprotein-anchoring transpeptidase ErfK/SrfK
MSRAFNFLSCVATTAFLLVPLMSKATERPAPKLRLGEISQLNMQVLLDRAGFSPGEIDGENGKNASKALTAFREDRGIPAGKRGNKSLLLALGASSIEPIVHHKITAQEAAGPFNANIPRDMMDQSKLPGLYYRSVLEQLGEEFHAAPALLKRLNPSARFTLGEEIRVPNVSGAPRGAGASGEPGAMLVENHERVRAHSGPVKVVVSKQSSSLTVYDKNHQIIFHAPVTSGSEHDPLPLGEWVITEVVRNPTYNYNPKLFWDADSADASVTIAAGPNNPVGDVWIDLNKVHYGIHGTPEPARIGYAESHGCVRLTNWDALEVASLVAKGTPVVFEP